MATTLDNGYFVNAAGPSLTLSSFSCRNASCHLHAEAFLIGSYIISNEVLQCRERIAEFVLLRPSEKRRIGSVVSEEDDEDGRIAIPGLGVS